MKVPNSLRAVLAGVVLVGIAQVGRPSAPPGADDDRTGRPTGPVDPATCITCHDDVVRHDALHGPVTVNACDACHTLVRAEDHAYALAREGTALCTFCHDTDVTGAAVVHAPLRDGTCTDCHDPHGGPMRSLLRAPTTDALCRTCHTDVIGTSRHVHGPVAVGACSACHEAHASEHRGLLNRPEATLCTSCHASVQARLESARFVHEPARDQCLSCHDAHGSNEPMMLRAPAGPLCLSCHETIRHTVETATHPHAAVTSDRQCMNCHDPHASDHPRELLDDMKTLCYECHDRAIKLPDGSTLANIKEVIETGTSLHGPVAQGNCAACHMLHGGDHFRLLVQEYPADFYAPFAEERYALCFSCHDKRLVYDERSTALTDFRDGDRNLHFVHVNREKKGRSCRACHETHASLKEKHIRESVPFGPGGWKLPIGFEKTDTGGSCAPGCHVPYRYDRVEPVGSAPGATDAIWPAESP